MVKRVDNDATQEVSSSMVVSDTNPPRPVVSKNDVSMWLSQPVSADDFMAAPKHRPSAPTRSINWIVPIVGLVFLALGGVGIWYGLFRESSTQTAATVASADAGSSAATATGSAAGSGAAAAPTDAGVTAVDAAMADASVAPGAAPTEVDAISGADLAVEKVAKKRPANKKKLTKKKTATATKKKRR